MKKRIETNTTDHAQRARQNDAGNMWQNSKHNDIPKSLFI